MIRLEQIAYDDFISVRADDPAEQAGELVRGTTVQKVVVRRQHEGRTLYYLFPRDILLARWGGKEGVDLGTALDLHEWQATPLEDADSNAEKSPDLCVVQRDGELIGYYDVEVPVNTVRSSRSPDRTLEAADTGRATESVIVRHVHADFPDEVPQNKTVSLLISLRQSSGGGTELPVAPADGVIDVIVRPRKGFAVEGDGEGQLKVTGDDSSLPIQFKLRAVDVGPGRIEVFCFQNTTSLGSVIVYATVLDVNATANGKAVEAMGSLAPPPAADADLMFLIEEWRGPTGKSLQYTLKATDPSVGLNFNKYYSESFALDAQLYFRNFYYRLDQRLQEAGGIDATNQLAAYGSSLFDDLFPKELQALLWTLRDRIKTVQVLSEEPWVPWELVKLTGQDKDGNWVAGPFLCQAFRLTRWFTGVPRQTQLRLRNMAVVAPADAGLPHAGPERDALLKLAVPNVREVTNVSAKKASILSCMLTAKFDGWHYVGHGSADTVSVDESRLALENKLFLRVNDLSGDVVRNCARPRPFIFWNACQSGQAAMGLTGSGGWAAKFIKNGAAAFVGTLWSVQDNSAKDFATSLYDRLFSGKTLADAVFEARQSAGLTGLAYTVFGDPFATVGG